jgi:hypothetical protein
MLKRNLIFVLTVIFLTTSLGIGNAAPKASNYSPSAGPYTRCEAEKNLKGDAKRVQEFLVSVNNCVTANRIVNSKLTTAKPKTKPSAGGSYASLDLCKLSQNPTLREYRGFPVAGDSIYAAKRHPSAGSVIQVIGVSAPDAPAGKKLPGEEYKYNLDLAMQWFASVNNSNQPVKFRVSNKWYEYDSDLKPLGITHTRPSDAAKRFGQKVVDLADSDIDFTDVDYVLMVVPAATTFDVITQGSLGSVTTSEGSILNVSVAMPANFTKFQQNNFTAFLNVTMWIHELYHPGFNMGDQVGDGKWLVRGTRSNLPGEDSISWPYANRGMGEWGMFANGTTDMLQWQKWLLGLTTDSQVYCSPTDVETISWLVPGSTKSSRGKLLVVPISATEAIVVESVRATGLNYKLQKYEQGALVYTIDMTDNRFDYGYSVQFPDNRPWKVVRHSMDTAPFKKGESFTYKGVKITNIEWGEFGDVIKVEPVK